MRKMHLKRCGVGNTTGFSFGGSVGPSMKGQSRVPQRVTTSGDLCRPLYRLQSGLGLRTELGRRVGKGFHRSHHQSHTQGRNARDT